MPVNRYWVHVSVLYEMNKTFQKKSQTSGLLTHINVNEFMKLEGMLMMWLSLRSQAKATEGHEGVGPVILAGDRCW